MPIDKRVGRICCNGPVKSTRRRPRPRLLAKPQKGKQHEKPEVDTSQRDSGT